MGRDVDLLLMLHGLKEHHVFGSSWPGGEWPVRGSFQPEILEIAVGAVLTQNTRWENVELALTGLEKEGLVTVPALCSCESTALEGAIHSAGFFRQKAATLKRLAGLFQSKGENFLDRLQRGDLLGLKGIGPETADAILLYAARKPHFVVDAYTRRILKRYGNWRDRVSYDWIKAAFEKQLTPDVSLYQEYHALLVEHAKQTCTKLPQCSKCVLRLECRSGIENNAQAPPTRG